MNFDEVIAFMQSALQSVEMPLLGALSPELALFALSIAFFSFSTAVCAMAVKAAAGARNARADAQLMMRTVQDYAVEVRQLAAKTEHIEHAASAAPDGLAERLHGVRVGARYDTDEADVDVAEASAEEADAAVDDGADDQANARLADATRAASEPRSLLSGILRRR